MLHLQAHSPSWRVISDPPITAYKMPFFLHGSYATSTGSMYTEFGSIPSSIYGWTAEKAKKKQVCTKNRVVGQTVNTPANSCNPQVRFPRDIAQHYSPPKIADGLIGHNARPLRRTVLRPPSGSLYAAMAGT
jgi:hypothetical protein